ncbi:MAG: class I SAM-dependent RNA methyltransferase [Deltaproteobacteria bacterium]|nr:class I SAM-dependent RNA methyltransferase [Deltaproteobacteria bacterium]
MPPPPPGQEVGEEVEVQITGIAPKGDGIGQLGDKAVFASRTIPGERIRVQIRRHRREWIAVDVLEVLEPSPDRVEPRCPLFGRCSGCQLQHVAYPRQLTLKRDTVIGHLREHGGFEDAPVAEVIGAEDPWYYRNHGRFTVEDGQLGFVRHYRREFLQVPHCYIMEPAINEVLDKLQGRLHSATQCNVRSGRPAGSMMIQPRLTEPSDAPPSGQPTLNEMLCGHSFRVSAAAFFQVNRAQAEQLIGLVREGVGAGPSGVVVDAYAGVGTFAVLLSPHVGTVIAIEESGPAVEDAKVNAAGLTNVQLRLGKSEEILGTLEGPVDAIILDPPRSGCQPSALQAVLDHRPARVVYVSCDPETLARDLRVLVDAEPGFDLLSVQPVDMFPHTHHIECVATLVRREGAATTHPTPEPSGTPETDVDPGPVG